MAIKLWVHSRDGEEESANIDEDLSVFQSQMKLQYSNIASILAMCTDSRPYYIIYEFLDCVSVCNVVDVVLAFVWGVVCNVTYCCYRVI